MSASLMKHETDVDADDPIVVATQLYEMHGYQKAIKTVIGYIDAAENYTERFEWERIAEELACLSITDKKIERAGLS